MIKIVEFARAQGMQVTAQRTGHNAEPLGDALDQMILVKTDAMQGVEIDVERRIARVRAGAKWGNVVPQASDLGLAALHGSTPDVSVAGYSLGGGVGWYSRKLGLSANSVTAIELVTADGEFRRVDHENEPDLFWALRGGGGNFGIVTALEVQLYVDPRHLRGRPLLPVGALVRGAARVARVDGDGARRDDLGRPDPPVPADARAAGAPPRPEVRDRRGHLHRRRGQRPRPDEAAPRPRPGDGHLRDGRAGRPVRAAHGSADSRAVHRRGPHARQARRRVDRPLRRRRRPGLGLGRSSRPRSATWAGSCAGRSPATAPWRPSTPTS